jgi:hypothetical protein
MIHDRRRGDRRRRLLWLLGLLIGFYTAVFVWPTAWRYHKVGNTPVRTNRVTGDVEFLNLQGWQPVLPATDVGRQPGRLPTPTPYPATAVPSAVEDARPRPAQRS